MTACADVAQAMLKELAGQCRACRSSGAKTYSPLIDAAIRPCDVLLAAFAVNPEFRL